MFVSEMTCYVSSGNAKPYTLTQTRQCLVLILRRKLQAVHLRLYKQWSKVNDRNKVNYNRESWNTCASTFKAVSRQQLVFFSVSLLHLGVCSVLFDCFWLSVQVQLIACKDSSLKWPVLCRMGRIFFPYLIDQWLWRHISWHKSSETDGAGTEKTRTSVKTAAGWPHDIKDQNLYRMPVRGVATLVKQ